MDVSNYPNEINDPKDNISFSPFTTNHTASFNNITHTPLLGTHAQTGTPQRNEPDNRIMHLVITAIMLALFSLIVVYCLYMQNWWLLGILAIPLI